MGKSFNKLKLPYSWNLAVATAAIGVAMIIFGIGYNFVHFLDPHISPILSSTYLIGYAVLTIAPLFARGYKTFWVFASIGFIFLAWIAFQILVDLTY